MAGKEPLLLVGIDVGMTCTGSSSPLLLILMLRCYNLGVAWTISNENVDMVDPYVLRKWPGNAGGESDKVKRLACSCFSWLEPSRFTVVIDKLRRSRQYFRTQTVASLVGAS